MSISATKLCLVVVVGHLFLAMLTACEPRPQRFRPYVSSSALSKISQEPSVRIRVVKDATAVRLDHPHWINIGPKINVVVSNQNKRFRTPVTITRHKDSFVVHPNRGRKLSWALSSLVISPVNKNEISVNGVSYPNRIVLYAKKNRELPARYDVVNHVSLERYLPGVLHRELYHRWPRAVFEAQAIAARSYAIAQSANRRRSYFDLEATEASQVYNGAAAHWRARSAVRRTQGVVLAYQDQIIPAYYSSCCGGLGQDAAIAFPEGASIEPFLGRHHGTWCALCPYFRWGPIIRNRKELSQRLAAWGTAHGRPIGLLRDIMRIDVTAVNAVGRPAKFTIIDSKKTTFDLKPEHFRFACNFSAPHLSSLSKRDMLKSSHVEIELEAESVRFLGRGYGHGVGLCQWGARAMAKRYYNAQSILTFYYPGARIRRVY